MIQNKFQWRYIKSQKHLNQFNLAQYLQSHQNMDEFSLRGMFSDMGRPAQQKPKPTEQQQDDVECCDTKVWIWDLDEYEEFESDYLNQIFPFKINKNTMVPGAKFIFHFLASSMHYWIELVQQPQNIKPNNKIQQKPQQQSYPQSSQTKKQSEPQPQKLGLKHAKFLKDLFVNDESDNCIAFQRWGQQFMEKQKFFEYQEHQATWQALAGGELIHTYTRNDEEFEIIKYLGDNKNFCEFKELMEVMFLFYIDGVSFVKEEVDTWVYFLVFKKKEQRRLFVGALSKYIFKLSTVKQRHRISQVFILPNYQKYGHGKELIDVVYKRSLQNNHCFEITTQIPSFEYQCLRDYKETEMTLDSKIINPNTIKVPQNAGEITKVRDQLLGKDVLREIKLKLKLPGHQIERIAQILVFEKILATKDDMARAHFEQYLRQKIIFNRSPFKSRSKLPHITFFGQSPEMKEFYLEKAKQDFLRNQQEIQEILTETINGYQRVITKLHKMKKLQSSQ